MKRPIFKRIRNYLPFLLVLVLIFLYFNSRNKATVLVNQVSIANRIVKKTVSASGVVKSRSEANMSFTTGGQITKIYVSEGQKVTRGQLLATTDNTSLVQTAQSYKDAWDIAQREKDLFKNNKSQNITLYHGEKAYNIKLEEMNESVSQAEANYKAAIANLSKTSIYAPFNATVVSIIKKTGENATATETVLKLADLSTLYFEVDVDQSDYGNIKTGQDVDLNFDAFDGNTFKGKVNELPAQANADNSNFTIKVDMLPDQNLNLWIGMTGDAYMITQSSQTEVPTLIYNEVQKDEAGKTFVWVVRNGKVAKQYIETGLEGDIYTQIKTEVNDTIVVPSKDGDTIKEGYIAKIINSK